MTVRFQPRSPKLRAMIAAMSDERLQQEFLRYSDSAARQYEQGYTESADAAARWRDYYLDELHARSGA